MIKCLVSDLDGTLLLHGDFLQTRIHDKTVQNLKRLITSGVSFAIATGRTHDTRNVFEQQVGFNIDFIGSNGSSVIINNELVVDETISTEFYLKLVDTIKNQDVDANLLFVDSDGHHVVDQRFGWNDDLFLKMHYSGEINHYFVGEIPEWFNTQNDAKDFNKAVISVKSIEQRDKLMTSLQHFMEKENVDMFYSADIFIEIMPKGINKGYGIEALKKVYNLNYDEIAVVGDSFNDVSMFEQFYNHSFVMDNAQDEVKKFAKHVVSSVDEVILYIEKYNLKK